MMSVVWYLNGLDFAPAFSTFLFLLFGNFSAVIIAKLIGAKDNFNVFLFSSLLLINPIICRHLQFLPHHIPLALGFLLLTIVCEILHNTMQAKFTNDSYPTFWMLIYCSFIQALMIGVRQDFMALSCILFVAIFLKLLIENPQTSFRILFVNIGLAFSMFCLSIVIYFFLNRYSLSLTGMNDLPGNYSTFSSVVTSKSDFLQALLRVKGSMYDYFIYKSSKIAWGVKVLVAMSSLMMVVSLFFTARCRLNWNIFSSILLGILSTGLILILPWQIALFRNQYNSTIMTALLGLTTMWSVIFSYVSISGHFLIMRRVAKISGLITLVVFLYSSSRSCLEVQNKYDQLKMIASDILHDVKQVMNEEKYSTNSSFTIVIANSQRTLSFDEGYVFIEWVVAMINNDPRLDILGDDYLFYLTKDKRERVNTLELSMPEWPAKDYIKVDGDLIIVKLNPRTLDRF